MRLTSGAAALVLIMGLFFAGPHPAAAQIDSREGIALQNQILQLRRDIQAMQQSGGGGSALGGRPYPLTPQGGGGSEIAAQLLDRISTLEDQMRRLQGRIDEIDNARQRQVDDLAKQVADLSFKISRGGGSGGTGATGGGGDPSVAQFNPGLSTPGLTTPFNANPPGLPPAPAVRRTPELVLQEGNAALARRDYPAAEAAAREALSAPRGPRSVDAQFLLAQAMSAQRNYTQAAVAYDDAYRRNPSGSHAADSLLGLAVSLNAIGAKREACEALDSLRASFPTVRPELREPIATTRQRAGCR